MKMREGIMIYLFIIDSNEINMKYICVPVSFDCHMESIYIYEIGCELKEMEGEGEKKKKRLMR